MSTLADMAYELDLGVAQVVFSTRNGGVSEGPYESLNLGILTDDEPERVAENRRLLAMEAGLDAGRVAMGWQVHGTEIATWQGPPKAGWDGYATPGADLEQVDGHVTNQPDLALLVLVADCLPVALASEDRVAMLHCGWRGLAGGLIAKARERFHEPPMAAIGPGIGKCCYEVGEEVLAAFSGLEGVADGRMLDLRAVAVRQLELAGVAGVMGIDLCTSCNEDLFFSHRRDGGVTGRQCGLAWLNA